MYNREGNPGKNTEKINRYIINKTLEKIDTDNKKGLTTFLENKGFNVTEDITEYKDFNNLSRAYQYVVNKQSSILITEFGKIIKKEMDPINTTIETPQLSQNNNITRDELASILDKLFIRNNNSNTDNKPNNNNVRIPKPPTYDGTRTASTIENWYIAVERYLKFNNFDEPRWIDYSVILLTGRTQLWYSRITRNNNNYFNTWTAFKTALDTEFKPQFAARSARDRLYEVKQTHSIQHYIHNFEISY